MAQVKIEQGWLEGETLELVTRDGSYYSFKGIPYAEPPLGKLRFKAPQPPLPWDGVRKAKEHGPACPQLDIFTNEYVPDTSEDCLYLNVYTKDLKPKSPLPVMVFIHGGGFKSGSGNVDNYGPDFLVNHGVVLVTINYRLEAFGFLCLDTEDVPGNAGLKDQVAALRWVQKNISSFGGDPKNVTVFGESAGGSSTALHVLSPMSKGLFKRAIPMSGTPICNWSISFEPKRRAFVLGKQLGCETEDPEKLLEFLQSVPSDKLVNVSPSVSGFEEVTNSIFTMYHFTPVVEKNLGKEHFLTEDPLVIMKNGKVNDVDVLIGFTSEEALLGVVYFEPTAQQHNRWPEISVPRKILLNCTPGKAIEISDMIRDHYFGKKLIETDVLKQFIRFLSDTAINYDVIKFNQKLPKCGKRYLYRFSCESTRNIYGNNGAKFGMKGASHLDDLVYLFDPKKANLTIDKDCEEYRLVQTTCTLFTNFAKTGNPTPDEVLGVTWPEYDNMSQQFMDVGNKLTVQRSPSEECVQFWDRVYRHAGIEL